MRALPEAATDRGRVRGLWRLHRSADGSVSRHATFLGIPFAAAPVGPSRFEAPRPADAWDGVRECFAFGATSQRRSPWDPPRIPEPSVSGPAVLNVTVTTPDPTPGAGLPVVVYLHGGGFNSGSPASPWYGGQAFARDGVVTVVISYRVGFEGFGVVPGAATNRGVLDWLAALEWVQRNVAEFGGDPSRVTIAGQSAGGAAVMRLLTMPRAQHLFASAMAISPADPSATLAQGEAASRRMAAAVGVPFVREALKGVSELAFFHARDAALEPADDVLTGFITRNAQPLALGPVVDGDVCEASVTDALAAGVGADKPLYIGACAHEFNDITAWFEDEIGSTPAVELLERAGVPEALAAGIVDQAAPSTPEGRSAAAWALGQAMSDAVFRQVVAHWAPLRAATGAPTWVYDFRWGSLAPGVNGAAHCVDVPFGLDILGAPRVDAAVGDAPQALADAVHGDWLAMVRDGAVDAPQFDTDRRVIVYGADARRVVGTGYAREALLWAATRG